jgi:hypothetical protein
MAASDIQAKVRAGLAKAKAKAGSSSSPIVYLVRKTESAGGSPTNPATITTENIELPNAVFKNIVRGSTDGDLIQEGDMEIVSDGDVLIKQGEIITRDPLKYLVVSVSVSSPFGIHLSYRPVVRQQ